MTQKGRFCLQEIQIILTFLAGDFLAYFVYNFYACPKGCIGMKRAISVAVRPGSMGLGPVGGLSRALDWANYDQIVCQGPLGPYF